MEEKLKEADVLAKKADMHKKEVNKVKANMAAKHQRNSIKKTAKNICQSLLMQQLVKAAHYWNNLWLPLDPVAHRRLDYNIAVTELKCAGV